MLDFISTIHANTNASKSRRKDFDFVKAQLGTIQATRDFLVHSAGTGFGTWEPYHPKRIVTDAFRKNRLANVRNWAVGAADIELMIEDMRKARVHLHRHTEKGRFRPHAPADPQSWQYKTPQQVKP